jgi:hypothetical protein
MTVHIKEDPKAAGCAVKANYLWALQGCPNNSMMLDPPGRGWTTVGTYVDGTTVVVVCRRRWRRASFIDFLKRSFRRQS